MATELEARRGWSQLLRASDELHAAQLLLGDPVASPATAIPHLRSFWRGVARAAVLAETGETGDVDPERWLAGEVPGLDAPARERLRELWRGLGDGDEQPGERPAAELRTQLRAHLGEAQQLVTMLRGHIGGEPLARRGRRRRLGALGVALVLVPVLLYAALRVEVSGRGPWRAAYHPDRELESRPTLQRETAIEHDWGRDAPLDEFAPDMFSVRWDSCLPLEQVTELTLQINANDGARVFVNGDPVIDVWERDPAARRKGFGSATVELEAGVHHLRVEYIEKRGEAKVSLAAGFDGAIPGELASDRLRYPGDRLDDDDPCATVRAD